MSTRLLTGNATDWNGAYVFLMSWELSHPGGVNEVVKNLYKAIHESGELTPLVVLSDWNHRQPLWQSVDGRKTARMIMRSPYDRDRPIRGFAVFFIELPWILWRNWKFIKKHNVKVINAHYPGLSVFQWMLMKKLRIYSGQVILSLHGRDFRSAIRTTGVQYRLWTWLLHAADWVVSCSNGLADEVVQQYPNLSNRSVCIHNGVDVGLLNRVRDQSQHRYRDRNLGKFILNIGTFEYKKGQDVLLEAFAKANHCLPSDLNLVLVGRTSEMLAKLRELVDKLEISHRVFLICDIDQEEVIRILANAEAFVLSSRNEAFSIALLEAAALSIPIVATDVCGVKELIPTNKFGAVVAKDDSENLAKAIIEMIHNPKDAALKSKRLQSRVRELFRWDIACDHYLRLVH